MYGNTDLTAIIHIEKTHNAGRNKNLSMREPVLNVNGQGRILANVILKLIGQNNLTPSGLNISIIRWLMYPANIAYSTGGGIDVQTFFNPHHKRIQIKNECVAPLLPKNFRPKERAMRNTPVTALPARGIFSLISLKPVDCAVDWL